MDFEGTQIEGEMIELGALKCLVDENGVPGKPKEGIRFLVKPKNKVGPIVHELTGLSDMKLAKEGIPFAEAMKRFKTYIGGDDDKYIYVAYGNNDLRILEKSARYHPDCDIEFLRTIRKNFFDFSAFFYRYIRDEQGNYYSLANAMKHLGVASEGHFHDAYDDAYNLYLLYRTFAQNPPILKQEYERTIVNSNKVAGPIAKVMRKIMKEGSATREDFEDYVEEALK